MLSPIELTSCAAENVYKQKPENFNYREVTLSFDISPLFYLHNTNTLQLFKIKFIYRICIVRA